MNNWSKMLLRDFVSLGLVLLLLATSSCDSWDKNEKEVPVVKPDHKDTLNAVTDTLGEVTKIDSLTLKRLQKDQLVLEKIKGLPETKKLEEITKSKPSTEYSRLDYQIVERPSEKDPNYYVKVNEKSKSGTFVKLQFFVDAKNDSIKIYDPGEDRLLSLEEWRKLEGE